MSTQHILGSRIEANPCLHNSFGELSWHALNGLDGQHVCMIDASTDEHMTVSELKTRANGIAMALIERGVTKGDKIAFCGQNSIQQIVMRFVAYFTGNTIVLMNAFFGKHEVEQALRYTGAEILVISANTINNFNEILNCEDSSLRLVVVVDGDDDRYVTYGRLLNEGRDRLLAKIPHFYVTVEDIAVMCYSSGTTGAAKCIMLSHRAFMEALLRNEMDSNGKPLTVGTLLPVTISGGNRRVNNLIFGHKVIIFSKPDIELTVRSIEKYRIDTLFTTPIGCRKLFYDNIDSDSDLSCLRTVYTISDYIPAHISRAIRERHAFRLRELYAISELGCIAVHAGDECDHTPGSLGRVAAGLQVKVVDTASGRIQGPNSAGEICIRGNTLFSGYYNNEKQTTEAFDSEGWFKTGDIGHYDDKERLFLTGRSKSIITSGTTNFTGNISPVEIEEFLLRHKAVADVAVVGVNNAYGAQWPRAYVVLEKGHTSSVNEIVKYVSDNMFHTKQLKAGVVFVDDIKRTELGKIERKYYENIVKNETIE